MVRKDETLKDYHLRLAEMCEHKARRHIASISPATSDKVRDGKEKRAMHDLASAAKQRQLAAGAV